MALFKDPANTKIGQMKYELTLIPSSTPTTDKIESNVTHTRSSPR